MTARRKRAFSAKYSGESANMYIDTLAYQTKEFFYSLGLGFILGIFYDLTRIVRLCIYNGKKKLFIFDFFFAAMSALMSVVFVLGSCRGKFTFYVVFGIAVGFAVYRFSLGQVLIKAGDKIAELLKRLFSATFSFFRRLFGRVWQNTVKLTKKLKKNKKKNKNNSKKHLQEQ